MFLFEILESYQLDTIKSEDITRVIVRSQKCKDVALNGVIHLEENIADLERKFVLTDGERVTHDYIANKLLMFDAEFHKHHYKLVDLINGFVGTRGTTKDPRCS